MSQALSASIYERCSGWSDEKLKNLKADTAQGYAARAELTISILSAVLYMIRK